MPQSKSVWQAPTLSILCSLLNSEGANAPCQLSLPFPERKPSLQGSALSLTILVAQGPGWAPPPPVAAAVLGTATPSSHACQPVHKLNSFAPAR
jgi:hypothetical protein